MVSVAVNRDQNAGKQRGAAEEMGACSSEEALSCRLLVCDEY